MENKEIYVVYLTTYLGDKMPKYYIGSTSLKNIKNGYNGSVRSKKWCEIYKKEQTENKHLFKTEVIYECYDRIAALDLEYKFQKIAKAVEREDYYNMRYAGGEFGKRNLTTPESIAKGLETKRKNGTLGCTKETAKKIVETKRKNGTLKHTDKFKENYKKSMTLPDGTWNNNTEKRLKTNLIVNENGLTNNQLIGIKVREIKLNNLDENGLNSFQRAGKKLSVYLKTPDETGKTPAEIKGAIISKTLIEKGLRKGKLNSQAKKINIYDNNDNVIFECHGNFKDICKENDLPFKSLRNSYVNDGKKLYVKSKPSIKKYIIYSGWYAKEIE
jgi:predicted transcriptional regulator